MTKKDGYEKERILRVVQIPQILHQVQREMNPLTYRGQREQLQDIVE